MFDGLDFHRVDLAWLFRRDPRPRSIVIHQDMSILRNENCDIMWRHAPGLYERIERSVLRHTQHVFTVRRSAVERYGNTYPELASRISFLPTWFDSSVFQPPQDAQERTRVRSDLRQELGLPPASRLLVSVGRFDRQKDPLLMLQTFREVLGSAPDTCLLLVGDGVLRAQIEQVRQTLGLKDRVRLLGVMSPTRIAQVLAASDLFVMSSAYEGMPIAVLEALATGLPVVSTNVGEISTIVQDGVNGRISSDRKPGSLAAAVNDALAEVQQISGAPCVRSVVPYRPESVLRFIYENHLAQAA
jgi:glycosyltransferase involved in cell wall biosynthesis